MTRPSAPIITAVYDGTQEISILERRQLYQVVYEGRPVTIRCRPYTAHGDPHYIYPPISFVSRGRCTSAVNKLNLNFDTDKFTVSDKL